MPIIELDAAFIERHWPLDEVHVGPTLQRYATRTTIDLDAAQGPFVAKAYANAAALGLTNPSVEEIRRGLHVLPYLAQENFVHAPRLLATRDGETFVRTESRTVYLLERIPGTPPPDTPASWAQVGRIAARLNEHTDYPHPYPISVRGTIRELREEADAYPFREEFLRHVAQLDVLADQPASLIHAEINTANALKAPDGRLYLLDWDSTGTGPTVLEPGYPLIHVFLREDGEFAEDCARAFYDAYTAGKGMTPGQKELVFAAALLHALRYLKFGDTARRWARTLYALDNRDLLLSAIPTREINDS